MAKKRTKKARTNNEARSKTGKRKAKPAGTTRYKPTEPAAWKDLLAARLREVFGATSFRAVAAATNHNHETVRRFLTSGSPSVAFLVETSRATGVSVDWLLGLRKKKQ